MQITSRSPLITYLLCTHQTNPTTLNSTDSVKIRETGCLDMAHCLLTFCHTDRHVLGQSCCNKEGGNDNEASEQTNWASEMPVLTPENLPWMPATIPHITSRASGTAFRIYPPDMNAQTELLCINSFFFPDDSGLREQRMSGCTWPLVADFVDNTAGSSELPILKMLSGPDLRC